MQKNDIIQFASLLRGVRGWDNPPMPTKFEKADKVSLATSVLNIDKDQLEALMDNCNTVAAYDFASALGDTIKEKYESLYIKLIEVTNVLKLKNNNESPDIFITSPQISSVFEAATSGVGWGGPDLFQFEPMVYVGTINMKWRLYKCLNIQANQILLGYSVKDMQPISIMEEGQRLARISIANLVY